MSKILIGLLLGAIGAMLLLSMLHGLERASTAIEEREARERHVYCAALKVQGKMHEYKLKGCAK